MRKVRATLGGSNREIVPVVAAWRLEHPECLSGAAAGDMVPRAVMEDALALERSRSEADRLFMIRNTEEIRQGLAAPEQLKADNLTAENQALKRMVERLEGDLLLATSRLAALERERR